MRHSLRLVILSFLVWLPGCSGLFYYPDSFLHLSPDQFGYHPEEIEFSSKDGTALYGWRFPSQGTIPKGTVVQFHGNAGNVSSHFPYLVWLTHHGYRLFMFDYRGYGRSSGKPSQEGTYYDGIAALDQAWEWHKKNGGGEFIVVGQSLGGAIAMRAVNDWPEKDHIDLLVLDSTFMSYPRVARRVLSQQWFFWPFSWIAHLLISNEYGSEEAVKTNRIPLLVTHDREDKAVTFPNGEEIFETATSRKNFWILNQGRHAAVFAEFNQKTRGAFLSLLSDLSRLGLGVNDDARKREWKNGQ